MISVGAGYKDSLMVLCGVNSVATGYKDKWHLIVFSLSCVLLFVLQWWCAGPLPEEFSPGSRDQPGRQGQQRKDPETHTAERKGIPARSSQYFTSDSEYGNSLLGHQSQQSGQQSNQK